MSLIKHRRKELNLTQGDVAQYVGVSKACVTHWEKKSNSISGEKLIKLAQFLGIEPQSILDDISGKSDNLNDSVFEKKSVQPRPNSAKTSSKDSYLNRIVILKEFARIIGDDRIFETIESKSDSLSLVELELLEDILARTLSKK